MKCKFISAIVLSILSTNVLAEIDATCSPEYINIERSRHKYYEVYSNHGVTIINTDNKTATYNFGYDLWIVIDQDDKVIGSHGNQVTLNPGQSYHEDYKLMGGAKFPEKGHFKSIAYTFISKDGTQIYKCKNEGKVRVY